MEFGKKLSVSVSPERAQEGYEILEQLAGTKGFHPGRAPASILSEHWDVSLGSGNKVQKRLLEEGKIAPYPPGSKTFKAGYLLTAREVIIESIETTTRIESVASLDKIFRDLGSIATRLTDLQHEVETLREETLATIENLKLL